MTININDLKEKNKILKKKLSLVESDKLIKKLKNFIPIILQTAINLTYSDGGVLIWGDKNIKILKKGNISSKIKKGLKKDKILERIIKIKSPKTFHKKEEGFKNWNSINHNMNSLIFFPFENENLKAVLIIFKNNNNLQLFNSAIDFSILHVLSEQLKILISNNRLIMENESSSNFNSIYLQTVNSLSNAIDAKDEYTSGHSKRVAKISMAIAKNLSLANHEISKIKDGAILHDIGKINISENILNKKGKLTNKEYEIIKTHPKKGIDILNIDFLVDNLAEIIELHHERIDGKGYPKGLKGGEIPLYAKIVCVADAWDAMTSNRSYRKALGVDIAIKELLENAGSQFDKEIIKSLKKQNFKIIKKIN